MSVPVVSVATTVVADVAIAELVSAFLETAFPEADSDKPVYMTAIEATAQAAVSTILCLEIRSNLPGIYANDPTGGFISVPLTLALQRKMLTKFGILQQKLFGYVTNFASTSQPQA